jgi:hypothetical protein
MAIAWLIIIAVALVVWRVEREYSIEATQAIVKSVFLSLRLGFEAIVVVVLLNTTFVLIGLMLTGTGAHIGAAVGAVNGLGQGAVLAGICYAGFQYDN